MTSYHVRIFTPHLAQDGSGETFWHSLGDHDFPSEDAARFFADGVLDRDPGYRAVIVKREVTWDETEIARIGWATTPSPGRNVVEAS